MARIRTIKPEFWRDEDLSKVGAEAALLAIGLLNHADDEGYFSANPKLIEADVFPLRELSGSVTGMLEELRSIGYIKVFIGSDGKRYGQVVNFEKHQVINKKSPSKIKDLCAEAVDSGIPTVVLPAGKERKGKEQGKRDDAQFDAFWQAYPKKTAKDDARKAFDKRKPDAEMLAQMLTALAVQTASPAWTKDNGQFIPNPATWLNGGRWQDENAGSAVSRSELFAGAI
jgi:hypothetical protein